MARGQLRTAAILKRPPHSRRGHRQPTEPCTAGAGDALARADPADRVRRRCRLMTPRSASHKGPTRSPAPHRLPLARGTCSGVQLGGDDLGVHRGGAVAELSGANTQRVGAVATEIDASAPGCARPRDRMPPAAPGARQRLPGRPFRRLRHCRRRRRRPVDRRTGPCFSGRDSRRGRRRGCHGAR